MGLDYANERYVRLYTRDTVTWLLWDWRVAGLWCLLLRKLDRSGVLDLQGQPPHVALAAMLRCPIEQAEHALGVWLNAPQPPVTIVGDQLLAPNYIEANETPLSDAQRQREARERRRAQVTKRDEVSRNVTECHERSRDVTPSVPSVPSGPSIMAGRPAGPVSTSNDQEHDPQSGRPEAQAAQADKLGDPGVAPDVERLAARVKAEVQPVSPTKISDQAARRFAEQLVERALDPGAEISRLVLKHAEDPIRRAPGVYFAAWIKQLRPEERRGYEGPASVPERSVADRKREARERREAAQAADRLAAQAKADAEAARQRDEEVIAGASPGALQAALQAAVNAARSTFELAQLRRPDWRETALGCQLVAAQLRLQPGGAP